MDIKSSDCEVSVMHKGPVKVLDSEPGKLYVVINQKGEHINFQGIRLAIPLLDDVIKPADDTWIEVRVIEGEYKGLRGYYKELLKN